MLKINVNDAKIKLDDLLQAAKNGEEVLIVTENQETFKIVQVDLKHSRPQYGSAEGLFEIAEDFDDPLEDFKDYMP